MSLWIDVLVHPVRSALCTLQFIFLFRLFNDKTRWTNSIAVIWSRHFQSSHEEFSTRWHVTRACCKLIKTDSNWLLKFVCGHSSMETLSSHEEFKSPFSNTNLGVKLINYLNDNSGIWVVFLEFLSLILIKILNDIYFFMDY